MTDENTRLPERIYLQPDCCVDWSGEGRQWCEDDVWGDDCPDHSPAIEYTRKALAAQPRDDVRDALNRQCDNMAFALNHFDIPGQWYEKFRSELTEDRTALSQGDEQPEADPWEGNAAREGMMPDTDGLAEALKPFIKRGKWLLSPVDINDLASLDEPNIFLKDYHRLITTLAEGADK